MLAPGLSDPIVLVMILATLVSELTSVVELELNSVVELVFVSCRATIKEVEESELEEPEEDGEEFMDDEVEDGLPRSLVAVATGLVEEADDELPDAVALATVAEEKTVAEELTVVVLCGAATGQKLHEPFR